MSSRVKETTIGFKVSACLNDKPGALLNTLRCIAGIDPITKRKQADLPLPDFHSVSFTFCGRFPYPELFSLPMTNARMIFHAVMDLYSSEKNAIESEVLALALITTPISLRNSNRRKTHLSVRRELRDRLRKIASKDPFSCKASMRLCPLWRLCTIKERVRLLDEYTSKLFESSFIMYDEGRERKKEDEDNKLCGEYLGTLEVYACLNRVFKRPNILYFLQLLIDPYGLENIRCCENLEILTIHNYECLEISRTYLEVYGLLWSNSKNQHIIDPFKLLRESLNVLVFIPHISITDEVTNYITCILAFLKARCDMEYYRIYRNDGLSFGIAFNKHFYCDEVSCDIVLFGAGKEVKV